MKIARFAFAVTLVAWVGSLALAEPTYIGAEKCKICHKVEFTSWQGLAHAKAFDRLKPEEQGKAECLKCHATGASAEMPGVQCEACHGPGNDYKSIKVMKDRAASLAAGLVIPTKETCLGCHSGAPHELKPFDWDAGQANGVHEKKPAAAPTK